MLYLITHLQAKLIIHWHSLIKLWLTGSHYIVNCQQCYLEEAFTSLYHNITCTSTYLLTMNLNGSWGVWCIQEMKQMVWYFCQSKLDSKVNKLIKVMTAANLAMITTWWAYFISLPRETYKALVTAVEGKTGHVCPIRISKMHGITTKQNGRWEVIRKKMRLTWRIKGWGSRPTIW